MNLDSKLTNLISIPREIVLLSSTWKEDAGNTCTLSLLQNVATFGNSIDLAPAVELYTRLYFRFGMTCDSRFHDDWLRRW